MWPSPSWTEPAARVLVNSSFAAPGIHTNVVNKSAPDLFLVQFTLVILYSA